MDKSDFIQELYKKGCIKFLNDRLSIDLKIMVGYPNLVHYVTNIFKEKAETLEIDAIIGMSFFGIIYASYLSSKLNKPLCVIKTEKVLQREIADPHNVINKNKEGSRKLNIIVVVDSIEKGFRLGSFLNTIYKRIGKCNIVGIFTVCDNCIAKNKYLNLTDYYIFNIINAHDIINNLLEFSNISSRDFLQIYNTMNFTDIKRNIFSIENKSIKNLVEKIKLKKSNLFVSLYYTNFFHIVNIVNKLSPLICGIVINSNIIEQFTDEKTELLKKLADEKKICIIDNIQVVFNNRNLVIKLLRKSFALSDIVTVRFNNADELKIFKHFSLDLLKQMDDGKKGFIMNMKGQGYNNSFINQKVLELCSEYKKYITGILNNKREYFMKNNDMIYITDEVEMIGNTVQDSILNKGCDLAIYEVNEFKNLTREYLESIYSSVKMNRDSSWISLCKVNSIEF